jgi:hypothetical protein
MLGLERNDPDLVMYDVLCGGFKSHFRFDYSVASLMCDSLVVSL